jgi:hypothetical protein
VDLGSNGGGFFSHQPGRHPPSPRELTVQEHEELRASLDPVLRDLRAAGAIVPTVREQARDDDNNNSVIAYLVGVGTMGAWLRLGYSAAQRLADLADQVQEWEVEELAAQGRPATWPECPQHPRSHPLAAEERDGEAVWCCPKSGAIICRIGALPGDAAAAG